MTGPRVPLYDRLPEIYRIRDAEQLPPGQLAAYLGAVEQVFSALHENIEALYDDLFIETCDPWVIPYIADLLGSSHLKGETRTLRADVADTIALRRRKGTLGAIERLAANLTGWPARAVELRPNLAWAQHLNHQRPDAGGAPPWGGDAVTRFTPRRGGTVAMRDPAMLSLIGTPFDPCAYTPDVKRADDGARHVNLPNLAVWLWRLAAYRLGVTRPLLKGVHDFGPAPGGVTDWARYAVRFDLDPLDRPVRLFQVYERPADDPTTGVAPLTAPDAVGGPILPARLETTSEAGNPAAYVSVDIFTDGPGGPEGLDLGDVGLQLYLPDSILRDVDWRVRSANLCAWEAGLSDRLRAHDLFVDPIIGRVLFGVATAAERNGLITTGGSPEPRIYAGYTYGAVGPIGAHPVSRDQTVPEGTEIRRVNTLDPAAPSLADALANLDSRTGPLIIEIVGHPGARPGPRHVGGHGDRGRARHDAIGASADDPRGQRRAARDPARPAAGLSPRRPGSPRCRRADRDAGGRVRHSRLGVRARGRTRHRTCCTGGTDAQGRHAGPRRASEARRHGRSDPGGDTARQPVGV
jgi:hypothetical protein